MTLVILLYPNGQRREVVLSGIPQKGDTILLKRADRTLVVEHVLWMEASNGQQPNALLSVREAPE